MWTATPFDMVSEVCAQVSSTAYGIQIGKDYSSQVAHPKLFSKLCTGSEVALLGVCHANFDGVCEVCVRKSAHTAPRSLCNLNAMRLQ